MIERIDLPAGIADIWRHAAPALAAARKRNEWLADEVWSVGGGAVLAARFHHRYASRLNMLTTARWPLEEDNEGRSGSLKHEINAGTIREYEIVVGTHAIEVVGADGAVLRVETGGHDEATRRRPARVDGIEHAALDNATILHRILNERSERHRFEHVADVAAAGLRDAGALRAACARLGDTLVDLVLDEWAARAVRIEEESRRSGLRIDPAVLQGEDTLVSAATEMVARYA